MNRYITVWKLADSLNAELVVLIRVARNRKDYRFAEQLRGASLSITNNIAEGFERKSRKEFIHFLSIAKGSAGEVRSMLRQTLRESFLSEADIERLISLSMDVSRQLAQFMKYLHLREKSGYPNTS